jgi:ABC-type uncharacterized transport system involved in gliding motility auxiliary subunit
LALIGRILGAAGLLAAAFYVALTGFVEASWAHWVGAGSALAISAWVYLDWDFLTRAVGSRAGREQTMSWALIAVVGAIGLVTLHLVQRAPLRWDLSEGQVHSLDPQLETILRQVDPALEVRVIGFFTEAAGAAEEVRMQRFAQLSEAARSINPHIIFERINPEFEPLQTVRYGVSRSGTIVVTARSRDTVAGSPSTEDRSRSEQLDNPDAQDIANALLRIQQDRVRTVTFVSGHGEASPEEPGERGLTAFATVLRSIGYRIDTWTSGEAKVVPEATDILVIAGPTVALQSGEVQMIRDWVDADGSLFVLVDPELDTNRDPSKGLGEALLSWGLALGHDLVLDPVQSDQGIAVLPLGTPEGFHSIVSAMPRDIPLAFKMAQSVTTPGSEDAGLAVHQLVVSSSQAWGETDFAGDEVTLDPTTDHRGPVAFAAVAQITSGESESDARVVLVGDVDWLSDGRIAAVANGDFATRVIAFLGAQDDLIQLPPKDRSLTRLELTGMRLPLLILLAVLLVPGAAMLTGLVLWGMRRNL